MATPNPPATLDTPIAVKILFKGHVKKFKIPLRDLGANVLPQKVRDCSAYRSGSRRTAPLLELIRATV
jgi:next-to-BRCA1 protein 1